MLPLKVLLPHVLQHTKSLQIPPSGKGLQLFLGVKNEAFVA